MKLMPLTPEQVAEYELRATMAERERCAKIAEKFIRQCGSVGGREAAADIAARIRKQTEFG